MKKQQQRKLQLVKTTIKPLTSVDAAQGGVTTLTTTGSITQTCACPSFNLPC
jgi:hypothetical protein